MKRIFGWLDSLVSKAISNRLDKRKQVEEQDLRRVYRLLFKDSAKDGFDDHEITVTEMQKAVNEHLSDQIYSFASHLHEYLGERNDTMPSTARGPSPPDQVMFPEDMQQGIIVKTTETNELSSYKPKTALLEVSDIFKERFGYSLHVSDSSIPHPEAGKGLWLSGTAPTGSIVGIFPGISYAPIHYREMVGYPKIDDDNPYLISRIDGVIIDSKPWGHGPHEEQLFPGITQTFPEVYELEGRHPLAFAHFANHPPKGTRPNAMLAPFEIRTTPVVRPYVPLVKCMGQYAAMEPEEVVIGLALLAERVISDEEIFVNYRLNPVMVTPDWYTPVDEKENELRWA